MKYRGKNPGRYGASQRGAALIIALVLLLVLTVLAVSGMNSASTELVMAGNEQYRQEAFRNAETATEQAINFGIFDGTTIDTSVSGTVGSGTYAATITPQLNGAILSSAAGNTYEVAGSIHYEIQDVGTTVRNSSVTTWQGVAQVTPRSPGDFSSNTSLGSTF